MGYIAPITTLHIPVAVPPDMAMPLIAKPRTAPRPGPGRPVFASQARTRFLQGPAALREDGA